MFRLRQIWYFVHPVVIWSLVIMLAYVVGYLTTPWAVDTNGDQVVTLWWARALISTALGASLIFGVISMIVALIAAIIGACQGYKKSKDFLSTRWQESTKKALAATAEFTTNENKTLT